MCGGPRTRQDKTYNNIQYYTIHPLNATSTRTLSSTLTLSIHSFRLPSSSHHHCMCSFICSLHCVGALGEAKDTSIHPLTNTHPIHQPTNFPARFLLHCVGACVGGQGARHDRHAQAQSGGGRRRSYPLLRRCDARCVIAPTPDALSQYHHFNVIILMHPLKYIYHTPHTQPSHPMTM